MGWHLTSGILDVSIWTDSIHCKKTKINKGGYMQKIGSFIQNSLFILGLALTVNFVLPTVSQAADYVVVEPRVRIGEEAFYYKPNYMLPSYYSPEGKALLRSLKTKSVGELGLAGKFFWLKQSDLSGVLCQFTNKWAAVFYKERGDKIILMYLMDDGIKGIKLRETNKDGEEITLYEQLTGKKYEF
jgi:hypothetical protein